MKKALFSIITIGILGCNAQDKKVEPKITERQPKEEWSVNKELDENGNIIKYDSTYTWSYSNSNGEHFSTNLDSIMRSFNDFFNRENKFDWSDEFSFFPKTDSLLLNNFFKKDYFYESWSSQNFDIEQMMRQMDSTRNEFLKRFHPGLMESNKQKSESPVIKQ
ncbi:MAG: hypothetical protein AB7O47_00990 [Flavobacteriales bacterium]